MTLDKEKQLAVTLLEVGAIKFGEFRLKLHEKNPSAPLSPIYVDLRILRSFPDAMNLMVQVYAEMSRDLIFDLIADIPTSVTPLATLLSQTFKKPMISPRLEKKTHGLRCPIDGVFQRGQTTLLVDDIITKADSKFDAISVLEENGLTVKNVVVLIDREQGGSVELEKKGYECRSAFKISELLKFYVDAKRISEGDYSRTMVYLMNN